MRHRRNQYWGLPLECALGNVRSPWERARSGGLRQDRPSRGRGWFSVRSAAPGSETAAGCAAVGTLFLQIFPLLWGTLVSIRPPEVFPGALVPSADPQTNYVGENISQAQATCRPEASSEMGASMLKRGREEALCMYFSISCCFHGI